MSYHLQDFKKAFRLHIKSISQIGGNKLSFQSENLQVDYLTFHIPGSDNTESIAKYLFEKFNFNSTFAKGQNGTTDDWFCLNRN